MTNKGKIPFVEISSKYVDAPYKLGGFNRSEGFDCLSLIISLGRDLGIDMPTEFGGYTIYNYGTLWESDIRKAKVLLLNYIRNVCEEIHIGKIFVPDVVLVDDETDSFFGIVAGNGTILSSFIHYGVQTIPMRNLVIRRAFRWVLADIWA